MATQNDQSKRLVVKEAYRDLTTLSNSDLADHINRLGFTRATVGLKPNNQIELKAEEYSALLNAAINEKNNRANSRLTKIAIIVAAASTLTALANMYLALTGGWHG